MFHICAREIMKRQRVTVQFVNGKKLKSKQL